MYHILILYKINIIYIIKEILDKQFALTRKNEVPYYSVVLFCSILN